MISKLLEEKKYIMLDGAMGTMLQQRGLEAGELPELLNITKKNIITDIHREYITAGSDVIYANTFGANRYKLAGSGYSTEEVIRAGVANAVMAAKPASEMSSEPEAGSDDGKRALVALDVGPIGQMLKPTGTLSFDEAYDIFREVMIAGSEADIIVIETMSGLLEAKAALLAAKENTDKPVMVTMTFEKNGRSFTGCTVASMAATLSGLGADAIGFNCSLGPKEMISFVKELSRLTSVPIVIKPNAGLPDPENNTYDISPEEFADGMLCMAQLGAEIFGGCCGTNPEFIRTAKERLDGWFSDNEKPIRDIIKSPVVCSQSEAVFLNEPRVIGERINPTGKKLFKEALQRHDINYILKQAIEQTDAGADILDINVGLPGVDEKALMTECIEAVQGVVPAPLQIDTTNPDVLEAALRVYDGIPIINSVNGEDKSLDSILPLAAKYGAPVIGLTLDEDGIPATMEKRIEIAEKIIKKANEYGISDEKIIIDCLTLTASAEQAGAMMTICAIEKIKEKYNVKTVLGVSNISFGLPDRELINRTFLTMALTKGLDLAIINPNNRAVMETIMAYKVLAGVDENSVKYIEYKNLYGDTESSKDIMPQKKRSADTGNVNVNAITEGMSADELKNRLGASIGKGLKDECKLISGLLLKEMQPMDIVDEILIPALDVTGALFESGKIFLPQLIMSATAASACFEVIREHLVNSGCSRVNRGNVVLATVKGDIHDIGKNIVRVLMENYGYNVIDLGRDVEPSRVVNAIIENNAKLAGLSALMTTTLASMENTIKLIREKAPGCKIVVGGAVLTKDYAMKIGADYYAKDAKQSVDVARIVYGN